MKKLEFVHVDTCLPCYWGGHHKAHLQIPVYNGMSLKAIKEALLCELNEFCLGSDNIATGINEGCEVTYKSARAAINRIKPAIKGQKKFFTYLDEGCQEEFDDSVYAFFILNEI